MRKALFKTLSGIAMEVLDFVVVFLAITWIFISAPFRRKGR